MNFIKLLFKEIREKHIEEYATSCAYYTILSFIPLMMLILTLTKYVGLERQSLFFMLEQFFPKNILNNTVLEIIKEIYAKSLGTITISSLFILWSAGRGMLALLNGLHVIYNIKEKKKTFFYRLKAFFVTIFFIVLITFTLMFFVFGNSIQEKFQMINVAISFLFKFKIILFSIFLSIFLTLLYYIIANKQYHLKQHILGAFIASIACNGITAFYGLYIDIFKGFSVLYGSLTSLILAMMWVYGCMYSILLGANINQIMTKNSKYCGKRENMV